MDASGLTDASEEGWAILPDASVVLTLYFQAQSFAYNPVRLRGGDLEGGLTNATAQTQLPLDLVVTRDVQDT